MADCNGWTNKETWLVNLWLGDSFAALQEDGEKITAEWIEAYIQEVIFDLEESASGFVLDLLNFALNEINYQELAAHYADAQEEDEA